MEEVFDAEPRSEPWEMDEDEVEQISDFEDVHAPGGLMVEITAARARGCAKPTAAEEDAHYNGTVSRAVRSPANTGQHVVSASHVEPHRHGTLCSCTARACSPGTGKLLRYCTMHLSVAVALSPSTHAKSHWPDCFHQTCGFPGEGPMTTLDSPDAIGPSLTPTQELMACVMTRRRTRGEKWESEVCKVCEKSYGAQAELAHMREMQSVGVHSTV